MVNISFLLIKFVRVSAVDLISDNRASLSASRNFSPYAMSGNDKGEDKWHN